MSHAAANTARYEKRMKAKGFVRKHVWVPADRADEVEVFAKQLRQSAQWNESTVCHIRERVIAILRDNALLLKVQGFEHISLFGSFARGDATADSDIDLAVNIAPEERPRGLFGHRKFREIIQTLLKAKGDIDQTVDIVEWESMKSDVHAEASRERMDIF